MVTKKRLAFVRRDNLGNRQSGKEDQDQSADHRHALYGFLVPMSYENTEDKYLKMQA